MLFIVKLMGWLNRSTKELIKKSMITFFNESEREIKYTVNSMFELSVG